MLRRKLLFGLLFLVIAAAGAAADEQSIPHGSVSLVAPYRQISAGNPFQLGLLFRLEPGWHIYWKNPGDSGEPPRLTWQLPPGMQAREIDWPAPHRLSIPPLMDYGYEGQVLLPIIIDNNAALKPGETASISADLRAIVCREVCIPAKAHLTFSIPVRAGNPEPEPATKALFADAMRALPKPLPSGWSVSARESQDSLTLHIHPTGRAEFDGAWFAPLDPEQIDNAAPQQLKKEGGEMLLVLKKSDHLLQPLARLQGLPVLPAGAFTVDTPVSHGGQSRPVHSGKRRS